MNAAAKGARAERRARRLLEAAGFQVCRAAGSKGPADLIAWNATGIRFVSVKSGSQYLSKTERDTLQRLPRPVSSVVESWRFPDRCQAPLIERL